MTYKILLVDDEPANLRILERLFRPDHEVLTAESGPEALEILGLHDLQLIISDQRMPDMTGIEFLKRAAEMRPQTVRIVLTGYTDANALVEAINSGVVYKYVTKPWVNSDLQATVNRALSHHETIKAQHMLNLENERLKTNLHATRRGFVRALVEMLTIKDRNAYGHALRTSNYAVDIAQRLDVDQKSLKQISLAAFLHQIAYVCIPNHIRFKAEELTPEENSIAEKNFERGVKLLTGVPNFDDIALAIRHIREHYDGSGSPDGLHSDQIPLQTRIIAVAAAYDEMTSMRSYQPTLPHDEAIHILRSAAGKKLDPAVVNIFCDLISSGDEKHEAAVDPYDIGHLSSEVVADFVESSAI
jgi:response regulator RpfG family c-di-GMP phosphodiesterase